ncbi:MAG TPA: APC family permease [Candidatus Rubrimentiphilum sp.]|nr:APC family permease [Candidatus Rubrimentiphilum sp.]
MSDVRALRRVLGPWSVVAFGVTNQVGAGLFFVSTQVQQTAPGVGDLVPWLMLVGGALTFLTVIAYRYFFSHGLIGAGGEYVIVSRTVNPFVGFLVTFLAWFGMTGSLGTLAYAAPKFLATAFDAPFFSSDVGTLVTGLALLWIVWLVHVRGVRLAAAIAVLSMGVVVVVTAVVIVFGFGTSPQAFSAALTAHLHLSAAGITAQAPVHTVNWAAAFGTALPVLFFAYLGLSTATQTGDEAVDARRTLGRGVLIAVCIVTAIYVLFTFAIYHAVPWQVIAGLAAMKLTAYTTSTGLLGLVMPAWLASVVNLGVAFIMVKTFIPLFLAQSRWIYAWGKDGLVPDRFAQTHERYATPVLALTISALLASLSLVESLKLGYVFGVGVRVFSVMGVFFFVGLGMLLYSAKDRNRLVNAAVAIAIMAFALWFAISIAVTTHTQAWYLQPIVQTAIVAAAGVLIYRFRSQWSRPAPAAATPEP